MEKRIIITLPRQYLAQVENVSVHLVRRDALIDACAESGKSLPVVSLADLKPLQRTRIMVRSSSLVFQEATPDQRLGYFMYAMKLAADLNEALA